LHPSPILSHPCAATSSLSALNRNEYLAFAFRNACPISLRANSTTDLAFVETNQNTFQKVLNPLHVTFSDSTLK